LDRDHTNSRRDVPKACPCEGTQTQNNVTGVSQKNSFYIEKMTHVSFKERNRSNKMYAWQQIDFKQIKHDF